MKVHSGVPERQEEGTGRTLVPFVHRFKTDENNYVFDVNTGALLRVDDVVWEIVEDFGAGKEEILARHASHFTPEQITRAWEEIARARTEDGCLLDDHPRVEARIRKEDVHDLIHHQRKTLVLDLTEKCNFRCTYCGRNLPRARAISESTRDMSWEVARAAMDDFLQHSRIAHPAPAVGPPNPRPALTPTEIMDALFLSGEDAVTVCFYGGEPLLNFPLLQRCTEYLEEKTGGKVLFGISTNGYLLSGAMADFLGTHDFRVRVSLDGPAPVHDKHRRTRNDEPTCAVVLENIRAFIKKYPRQLSMVAATLARGTDVRAVYEYFASADWIPPTTMRSAGLEVPPYPGYYPFVPGVEEHPGLQQSYEQFQEDLIRGRMNLGLENWELELRRIEFERTLRLMHRTRWNVAKARRAGRSYEPDGPCLGGAGRTFVSVTGEYYACERVPRTPSYQIGSVATGMDEEKAYALLKEFIECSREECERCWCLPFCTVGCHASVHGPAGFTKEVKKEICDRVRTLLHRGMVVYCHVLEQNPRALDYLNSKPPPTPGSTGPAP